MTAGISKPLLWIVVAILICVATTYRNVSENGFAYDDVMAVEQNPRVTGGLSQVQEIFRTEYWDLDFVESRLYRPLTLLSFAAEASLWGLAPARLHLTNAALHALASVLLAVLVLVLLARAFGGTEPDRRGRAWAAGSAGVLFAAHPLYTEAVAGLVGRAELLSAVFTLGFLLALLARGRWKFIAAPLALLALLSKETSSLGICLFFAVCVFGLAGDRRDTLSNRLREFGRGLLILSPGLVVAGVLRYLVLHGIPKPNLYFVDNPLVDSSVSERLATASTIFLKYLQLHFWPVRLAPDYGYDSVPIRQLNDPVAIAALGLLFGTVLLGLFCLRRSFDPVDGRRAGLMGIGLAWFVGSTLVIGNFFFLIPTTIAERLAYLPGMGLFILLAVGLAWVHARRSQTFFRFSLVALAVVAGLFVLRTDQRVRAWKNNETLFSAAVIDQPRSHRVWAELASVRMDEGDLSQAKELLLRSRDIYAGWNKTHDRLVAVLMDLGELDAARVAAEDLRALDPTNIKANYALARVHQRDGEFEAAMREVRSGMTIDPEYLPFYLIEGEVLEAQGNIDSAVDAYLRVLRDAPQLSNLAVRVGPLLVQTERWEEAGEVFRSLYEVTPNWSHANYLAWSLLQSVGAGEEETAGGVARLDEAIDLAREATALAPPESVHYPKDTLGQTLWRRGLRSEAIDVLMELVEENPTEPIYRERLRAYRSLDR